MLQRLYVHNFRCLRDFEFKPGNNSSVLLIGKNGSGKSTIRHALKVLQRIGQGETRIGQLIGENEFAGTVAHFEIDAFLENHSYAYTLTLERSDRNHNSSIINESLAKDGVTVFTRHDTTVSLLPGASGPQGVSFDIDPQLAALTTVHHGTDAGSFHLFRNWLGQMILLSPIPQLMDAYATQYAPILQEDGSNIAGWLYTLLSEYPAAYASILQQLQDVFPDLAEFRLSRRGRDDRFLQVRFKDDTEDLLLPFDALSEGEKCFFLSALVLAANKFDKPLFVFWDEPANYLSLGEISHFVMALRRGFGQRGQIVMASHNDEAVRRFSRNNTWVLGRKSHLAPTVIRLLEELPVTPDVVQSMILGELEP